MKFNYTNQFGPGSMEIDITKLEGCPGCGHVPLEYEIENEFIYPAVRDRSLWEAVCTEGGGGGCGWSLLADSPEKALEMWNKRSKKEVIKKHECKRPSTCCCNTAGTEPSEDCPIHGCGEWPPRCEICGKFMRWEC